MKKFLKIAYGLLYTATYYPLIFKIKFIRKTKGNKEARSFLAEKTNQWATKLEQLFNFTLIVKGEENFKKCNSSFVIISNHESAFDIPIIQKVCGNPAFIAKKELKKTPVISAWMKELECTFLDRSNARKALQVFNESADALKNGKSFVVFPEGTRSPKIMPFKKGSFKLAKIANVPIIPITIKKSSTIIEQSLDKELTKVEIIITEPIFPPFPNDIHTVTHNIIEKNYY